VRKPSAKVVSFLAVTPFLLGFDVWTKDRARELQAGEQVEVIHGWVSLIHAENPDIAFSMQVPHALIYACAAIMLVAMAHMLWNLKADAVLPAAAIGAITAGAVGNLVDRLADGSVTDFMRLDAGNAGLRTWAIETFGTATWPIFNVADVALVGGMGLFVIGQMFEEEPQDPNGS